MIVAIPSKRAIVFCPSILTLSCNKNCVRTLRVNSKEDAREYTHNWVSAVIYVTPVSGMNWLHEGSQHGL